MAIVASEIDPDHMPIPLGKVENCLTSSVRGSIVDVNNFVVGPLLLASRRYPAVELFYSGSFVVAGRNDRKQTVPTICDSQQIPHRHPQRRLTVTFC